MPERIASASASASRPAISSLIGVGTTSTNLVIVVIGEAPWDFAAPWVPRAPPGARCTRVAWASAVEASGASTAGAGAQPETPARPDALPRRACEATAPVVCRRAVAGVARSVTAAGAASAPRSSPHRRGAGGGEAAASMVGLVAVSPAPAGGCGEDPLPFPPCPRERSSAAFFSSRSLPGVPGSGVRGFCGPRCSEWDLLSGGALLLSGALFRGALAVARATAGPGRASRARLLAASLRPGVAAVASPRWSSRMFRVRLRCFRFRRFSRGGGLRRRAFRARSR